MKIVDVICSSGRTGFYFDDQRAIKKGAVSDGATYIGEPVTEGFTSVRQSGESISVMIVLEDKQIAFGDCAAVQYSGAGGRDPLFLADDFIPIIYKYVKPVLIGKEANNFKQLCELIEDIRVNNKKLHTAIRYGVTQAILDAVAKSNHILMCDVIAKEYSTNVSDGIIPIFTQSGDARYENADKMIIKKAQVMPHALINNVIEKLGYDGEILKNYVEWLRNRIIKIRNNDNYSPDLGGINNIVEAVLYCKNKNIGAYQGGTCNETDRSAQICAHIAMATKPNQILAKPGMGVDEGYMIVFNEMQRILALKNIFNK